MSREDADFIWMLLPKWVKDHGTKADAYDPMYFGTLSRNGDIEVGQRARKILGIKKWEDEG
jgi:hypothetical protein